VKHLRQINLNALRIAEAAARHRSFTRAGEEQLISPSAVSQRISRLEDQLQFKIFRRQGNTVSLTREGEGFVAHVKEALDKIVTASREVNQESRSKVLRISVLPTFAVRWLMPRLVEFQKRHPDIVLHMSTAYEMVDFAREDFDCAIRYGTGNFEGLYEKLLFQEDLTPVCTPKILEELLAKSPDDTLRPRDLEHATLLHSDTCTANWQSWLRYMGIQHIKDKVHNAYFDTCMLSFEAANQGMGFAVANRAYVMEDINKHALVAPFASKQPNNFGWHLVCPHNSQRTEKIQQFEKWLLEKADDTVSNMAQVFESQRLAM